MTLQWLIHDDGYMWAQGRKGRYVISEGFGNQRGMIRMSVNRKIAFFTRLDDAKDFAEGME
mgnify:FL=1